MTSIVIFIVFAIVYFIFIRPKVNPTVSRSPEKVYHFNNMAIFTQNGERKSESVFTEFLFFNNSIVLKGQITDFCRIEKVERGLEGDLYFCAGKGNSAIIICDHFLEKQVHYFISENIGYRFF